MKLESEWLSRALESVEPKSFGLISNSNQFPGNWKSKIHFFIFCVGVWVGGHDAVTHRLKLDFSFWDFQKFVIPIYKILLKRPLGVDDIKHVDEEIYNSMMWIKNNNIEDVGLSMFFEVDVVSVLFWCLLDGARA